MPEFVIGESAREGARFAQLVQLYLPAERSLEHCRPNAAAAFDGGKGKPAAVGHAAQLTEAFATDAVLRPAFIETQIAEFVLFYAALAAPCARHAHELHSDIRKRVAARHADAAQ